LEISQIAQIYAIIWYMPATKIVVTVALFTVIEDFNFSSVPRFLVSLGDLTEKFGLGLFVVTRRTNEDALESLTGRRVLPASDVRAWETVEDAAHRMVREDLGVQVPVRLRQERIFDDPKREQDQRVISINYWGFANLEDVAPILGGKEQVGLELVNSSSFLDDWAIKHDLEDFDGVCRFGLRSAPLENRAHDRKLAHQIGSGPILDIDHDEMVFYSWRKLRYAFRGRLDPFRYLGATALSEAFRLSDLKELNDVCRGERTQVDQFRRSVLSESSFIAESDIKETKQRRPGKPATLYSLRDWANPTKDSSGSSDYSD
jgi:ADP-ribose pyrophosphatase YjhB (NUDIX family)